MAQNIDFQIEELIEVHCFILIFDIQLLMNKKEYYVFIEVGRMTALKSLVILMAFFKVSQ